MNYPVDPERMRKLEKTAREIGAILGHAIDAHEMNDGEHYGFALFVFAFGERGEMTYISNSNRADMVKMLLEFIAANSPEMTWDEQHG